MTRPTTTDDVRGELSRHAPWLLDPELEVCVVGSAALAEACRRADVDCPPVRDIDLAWRRDVRAGQKHLEGHGVALPVTAGSLARGTLAFRAGPRRIEITTLRGEGATPEERLHADLARRDMTIGAIAWSLHDDRVFDPFHGIDHWRAGRIEPVGDPAERVADHPIRYLRCFRRAHALGFTISSSLRKLAFDPRWAAETPPEAAAGEFRRILEDVESPGRCLMELHESGALAHLAPELDAQFDGRPAGPIRHHPEISQALHLVLALEWAKARTMELPAEDRTAVLVAVLCHDLGKGLTAPDHWPAHHAHESRGVDVVHALLDRLPGLTDARGRKLAEAVCQLHLEVRQLRALRPGTVATLYEKWFRAHDFPLENFALAVGADVGGRLGLEAEGARVRSEVLADLTAVREVCGAVDAAALRARHGDDLDAFRNALHGAWCSAIRHALAVLRPQP